MRVNKSLTFFSLFLFMFYLPQWGLNKVANVKSSEITMQKRILEINMVAF